MFGAEIPNGQGLGEVGDHVLRIYTKYLQVHINVDRKKDNDMWEMRCDDTWLKYLQPDDDHPLEKGKKIKDVYHDSRGRSQGIYYAESLEGKTKLFWPTPETQSYDEHPLCGELDQKNFMLTDHGRKEITMCLYALNNSGKLLAKLTNLRHGETYAWVVIEKIMAYSWVHELGDLMFNWDDPKIRLRQEGDKHVWDEKSGKSHTVYQWNKSYMLAAYQPQLALKTPDNYANFALAMYLKDFWWLYGFSWDIDDVTGAPIDVGTKKPIDIETGETFSEGKLKERPKMEQQQKDKKKSKPSLSLAKLKKKPKEQPIEQPGMKPEPWIQGMDIPNRHFDRVMPGIVAPPAAAAGPACV